MSGNTGDVSTVRRLSTARGPGAGRRALCTEHPGTLVHRRRVDLWLDLPQFMGIRQRGNGIDAVFSTNCESLRGIAPVLSLMGNYEA